MATRGASGGLTAATGNVTVALEAFGFDIILIETVGVGQVELDIIDACDTVVVAIVPESGDAVQAMKAGLMEIADLFVINKADRPGSERLLSSLKQTLETRAQKDPAWQVPIISTVATERKNIDKLNEKINEHIQMLGQNGRLEKKRQEQICKKIIGILKNRYEKEFLDKVSDDVDFNKIADDVFSGKTNPYQVAGELFEKFKSK